MMTRFTLAFGLLLGAALPSAAGAQNPQPAPPQVTHPPVAPPGVSTTPPEQIAPPDRVAGTGNTTLSDKLSQQQGTLRPPAVDPGMQALVPSRGQGTMPVIPPPGTPGGDQRVVPK
jgi:hypothetical protein